MGDSLPCIIHRDCQLVRENSIATAQYKITQLVWQIELQLSAQ